MTEIVFSHVAKSTLKSMLEGSDLISEVKTIKNRTGTTETRTNVYLKNKITKRVVNLRTFQTLLDYKFITSVSFAGINQTKYDITEAGKKLVA